MFDAKQLRKELDWESDYLAGALEQAYAEYHAEKDSALKHARWSIVTLWQGKIHTYNDLLAKLLVCDAIDDDDLACLTVSCREVKE